MPGFVYIDSSRLDANSAWTEDEAGDLSNNTEHNFEHAVRGGTYGSGVRLVVARGRTAWSMSSHATTEDTTAIVFATDAADGDPNFDSGETPVITYSIEEDAGSTGLANLGASMEFWHWVGIGTLDYQGFSVVVHLDDNASNTYSGYINWTAHGLPSTDE